MKPIKFPEHNRVFAENQPEYTPLPALVLDTPSGDVISCWQLTFWERLQILYTGKLWVSLMMFGRPLTPSYFTVKKSDLIFERGTYYLSSRMRVRVKETQYASVRQDYYRLEYRVKLLNWYRWVLVESAYDMVDGSPKEHKQSILDEMLLRRRHKSLKRSSNRRYKIDYAKHSAGFHFQDPNLNSLY